jgi:hypothetical protein
MEYFDVDSYVDMLEMEEELKNKYPRTYDNYAEDEDV